MLDMWSKGRHTINQSHEHNNYAKLTEADVSAIRGALATAKRGTNRILAKQYGVHEATISYIKQNKIWQGVN